MYIFLDKDILYTMKSDFIYTLIYKLFYVQLYKVFYLCGILTKMREMNGKEYGIY